MKQENLGGSVSRRNFVRVAAGAMAGTGLVLTGCEPEPPLGPAADAAKGGNGGGKPKPPTTRHSLYVPPTVAPVGLTLAAAPGTVDLGGGENPAGAWAYNGGLPGPTIRARQGDQATITYDNGLGDESITHWHGMIIDDVNDGHPRHAVNPGQSYSYDFPIVQRAAMNWYHPHPHGKTGEQVNMGLAGAFIIEDTEELALGLPAGAYEIPIVLRDAKFDRNGNIEYKVKRSGYEGDTPLVNGTLNARVDVDNAVYRLRILCGSNARIFQLALDSGDAFTVIGNDGGLLQNAVPVQEITMSPGERVDVLVDLRNLSVGDTVMLRDLNAGWDLLEFNCTGNVGNGGTIPTGQLSTITPLSNPVRERTFGFEGMSRINGKEYSMNRIDFQVPLGDTERWIFTTGGNAPHPVHVHAAPFQIESRTGGRGQLYEWEAGWKDTVLLGDGETVSVLVNFNYSKGLYLMHCHKLEHEDAGMMMNFEIV
jgi:blue copper oxidase